MGVLRYQICLLIGILCIPFLVADSFAESLKSKQLTLLITSDIHGWLSTSFFTPYKKRKGLLHIQNRLEEIRAQQPQAILVDAGDLLSGSPLTHYYHYHSDTPLGSNPFFSTVLNLRYDAVVVGNHDLEIDPLLRNSYLPGSNFPWLAANVRYGVGSPFLPYVILIRNGLRIGILGISTPGVPMWVGKEKIGDLKIEATKASLADWIHKIRALEKPDLLIGVFHVGVNPIRDDENSKLNRLPAANGLVEALREVVGLDLVISGHDHRLNPKRTGGKIPRIRGTPVISAGYWAEALTQITLTLRNDTAVKGWKIDQLQAIIHPAAQDPKIDQKYLALIDGEYRRFLESKLPWRVLSTDGKRMGECMDHLNSLAQRDGSLKATALPIARKIPLRRLHNRLLTRRELFLWFPYDNFGGRVRLSQNQLRLLRNPAAPYGQGRAAYNRVVTIFPKQIGLPMLDESWWLEASNYEPKFKVLLSSYHYHGGGGLVPTLFLKPQQFEGVNPQILRDRLFDYLERTHTGPPECQSVLEPILD